TIFLEHKRRAARTASEDGACRSDVLVERLNTTGHTLRPLPVEIEAAVDLLGDFVPGSHGRLPSLHQEVFERGTGVQSLLEPARTFALAGPGVAVAIAVFRGLLFLHGGGLRIVGPDQRVAEKLGFRAYVFEHLTLDLRSLLLRGFQF